MFCSCGTLCKKLTFNTFEYWYCLTCKSEPVEKVANVDSYGRPYDVGNTGNYSKNPLDEFEAAHSSFYYFRSRFEKDMQQMRYTISSYNKNDDKLVCLDSLGQTVEIGFDEIENTYLGVRP